ncbi:uncharacterized protein F5147DRAFT_766460 [Suillus discolor]|uniref:Uncharacterized protein n=1 Tax=Suillus discolor TaxID=1912936 RepID=A0A9P7K1H4_9AGAM|nr:uncharacterized protein F5147DRAFT_766460 [Suillus discolor]KAG2120547.1 hypothetical protein F5147DRAFT_766460 [Suillus discolor]
MTRPAFPAIIICSSNTNLSAWILGLWELGTLITFRVIPLADVGPRGGQSLSTQLHRLRVPPPSSDDIIDAEHSNVHSTLLAMRPTSCANSSTQNASTSAPDAILGTASMEIDEDELSLAQRRSRRVGVPMPLHYRQYNDILPQPPLSVPSNRTTQQQEFYAPVDSTDASTATRTSLR